MQLRMGRAAKDSRAHLNAFETYCDVYVAAGVDELSLVCEQFRRNVRIFG